MLCTKVAFAGDASDPKEHSPLFGPEGVSSARLPHRQPVRNINQGYLCVRGGWYLHCIFKATQRLIWRRRKRTKYPHLSFYKNVSLPFPYARMTGGKERI